MNQYSMIIQWSDEDRLFLVTIPEFAELVMMPCTHGKTRDEAIRNGEEVIEMYSNSQDRQDISLISPRGGLCITSGDFNRCVLTALAFAIPSSLGSGR